MKLKFSGRTRAVTAVCNNDIGVAGVAGRNERACEEDGCKINTSYTVCKADGDVLNVPN